MLKLPLTYSKLLQLDSVIKAENVARYQRFIVLLCLILLLPALGKGLRQADIVLQTGMVGSEALYAKGLQHADPAKGFWQKINGAYVAFDPDAEGQIELQREYGNIPWWSYERIRIGFYRPVSAFTHWLDAKLWANSSVMMLAQNVLWFGLLICAASWLFRQVMGATTTTLMATLIFGLDCSLTGAVNLVSGRHLLLAGFFAVLTILAHHNWRSKKCWQCGVLAIAALAAALYSSEAAVAVGLWLIAYAISMDKAVYWRRILSLLPALVVILLWRLFYWLFGYGVAASSLYIDPVQQPWAFVVALVKQLPGQAWSQLFGIDLLWANFSLNLFYLCWVVSVLMLLALLPILLPVVRRHKEARFWAIGGLLALLPLPVMQFPDASLLLLVSLGASPLIAMSVIWLSSRILTHRQALSASNPAALKRRLPPLALLLARLGRSVLVVLHILLPMGWKLALLVLFLAGLPFSMHTHDVRLAQFMNDPRVSKQEYILVNPPNTALISMLPYELEQLARQSDLSFDALLPNAIRMLATGNDSVMLERIDRYTLRITPASGYLSTADNSLKYDKGAHPHYSRTYALRQQSQNYRIAEQYPLLEGRRVHLPGTEIIIEGLTDDGRPSAVIFQFERPLEDSRYRWLYWDWSRPHSGDEGLFAFDPLDLPAPGTGMIIKGPFD